MGFGSAGTLLCGGIGGGHLEACFGMDFALGSAQYGLDFATATGGSVLAITMDVGLSAGTSALSTSHLRFPLALATALSGTEKNWSGCTSALRPRYWSLMAMSNMRHSPRSSGVCPPLLARLLVISLSHCVMVSPFVARELTSSAQLFSFSGVNSM